LGNKAPSDLVCIGKIVKSHGLRGEVKILLFNAESEALEKGKVIWIQTINSEQPVQFIIESVKLNSVHSRIKLKGVDFRDEADKLHGLEFSISRSEFPILDEEEFYLVDLIGFSIQDENGKIIGNVSDIVNLPSNDSIVVEVDGKEIFIPILDDFCTLFDFENEMVYVKNIEGFLS
jgi:16S rRNA processing protein RimM